jgi:hypothetical protein
MESKQLALFDTDDAIGTGRPMPWLTNTSEITPESVGENPDQLTFDDANREGAA